MSYQPYADEEYYQSVFKSNTIPNEIIHKHLIRASRHIDSLTYNRIVGQGFFNLTEFQQEIIKEVCCIQAEFEYENEDLLDSILNSYSVNGVSMGFGGQSWNVFSDMGIAMKKDVYAMLSQTGLTCRLVV